MDTATTPQALRKRANALDAAIHSRLLMTEHRDSAADHAKTFRAAVLDAREAGCTMADIADAVGMSRQGLYDALGKGAQERRP